MTVLPRSSAIFTTRRSVSGEVTSDGTTSTSGSTGTGLKNCVPVLHDLVQTAQELGLDALVLVGRFDHQVSWCKGLEVEAERDSAHRYGEIMLGELPRGSGPMH